METQRRVVKDKLEYAGRNLRAGDSFDCELGHVELLLAFGKIEPVEGEEGFRPTKGYRTREMKARA